jgi:hypothetical protein
LPSNKSNISLNEYSIERKISLHIQQPGGPVC